MFKLLDKSKQIELSVTDAEKLYPKQKFLLVDTKYENNTIAGVIYAISEEPSSLKDLVMLEDKMQEQGHTAFVGGDYYPNCVFDYLQIKEECFYDKVSNTK